jgi:DNA-binding IclR family transcriptional regulator
MVSEDQMRTREAAMLACDLDEKFNIDAETSLACEFDLGLQVARAGLPVLERLAEDLGDLAVSIVLTDADANVLGSVQGDEHPAGARAEIAYVTAPIACSTAPRLLIARWSSTSYVHGAEPAAPSSR